MIARETLQVIFRRLVAVPRRHRLRAMQLAGGTKEHAVSAAVTADHPSRRRRKSAAEPAVPRLLGITARRRRWDNKEAPWRSTFAALGSLGGYRFGILSRRWLNPHRRAPELGTTTSYDTPPTACAATRFGGFLGRVKGTVRSTCAAATAICLSAAHGEETPQGITRISMLDYRISVSRRASRDCRDPRHHLTFSLKLRPGRSEERRVLLGPESSDGALASLPVR